MTVIKLHPDSVVRHLLDMDSHMTYCGLTPEDWLPLQVRDNKRTQLCGNCDRTSARYIHDARQPEIEAGATRRGTALAEQGRVREVGGRLFRVAGGTDTYTVTIPFDRDLAALCTCMAAKTHPEIMCKHISAAYLTSGEGP